MGNVAQTVFLVDDDRRVLNSLTRLLQSEGWQTRSFASPEVFLAAHDPEVPGCLVLDLVMPGMSGLLLQHELARLNQQRPILFLSGRAEISACVAAMKSGAVDFLTKPVEDTTLLRAVRSAIDRDAARRRLAADGEQLHQRLASLTERERQVVDGVVAGLLNKQIAGRLGIVEKTVKVHRAHAIAKLGAHSTAELVRLISTSALAPRELP